MKILTGGITSPKGFQATGSYIGIKKRRKDLAILYSEVSAVAAAVFTTNVVKAAPVLWNTEIIDKKGTVRAIVTNSGNANACTGEIGIKHAEEMAATLADCLKIKKEEVFVCSTGVIGVPLPMDIITRGIEQTYTNLSDRGDAARNAAEAILTTDTFVKEIAVEIKIDGKPVRIAGMAKGSGMIHPNMATMLGFITTDINISRDLLEKALREDVDDTYNMISVDGDTSTNDSVLLLANGLAGNKLITQEDESYVLFSKALHYVNEYLAQQIIRDGEGATKFLEVKIKGALSKVDARKLGKSVITSNLVKTAFFGEDANWGRVLAAMGYSGANFDPSKVHIEFMSPAGSVVIMKDGRPVKFDEDQATSVLKEREIRILITLQEGQAEACAWGCDLSYEYVRINGEYRT
ncbi:MAG: bifunctional ornithine acetyltransferase/N-acetylglutamate synthase [Candidatus Melainabacteria bacterium RIFOXYA12_FULL_32_12]|nr:MAG: bifunctional ornithine acetyltransferase/N-acetylglutamate synthase [Candidatus Melainabacteria bacterium RIFOXYA2_FULL_32_9]OGI29882.1 MAG: bifunctional ornithine acetyltransferase/N-acetylglutamate synthase [Candidatus Melainabacteria bacterium RIFOXYA12_FULL_32_12]